MTLITSTLLAVALVAAAPDDDKALAGDLAKLQGAWTAMVGPDKDVSITVEFSKQNVVLKGTFNDQDFMVKGEVVLNEKAAPKTIDWVKFTSPQGDEVKDNLGIYKLDGDTLTVCSGGPGNARPAEFKAGEGGPPNLTVFTRKKTEAKPKEDAPKGDVAAFQGRWKALIGPNKDRPIVVIFIETRARAKLIGEDGNEIEINGEFLINDTVTPKTIDFVKFKTKDGDDHPDNLGIYKLDGEVLTICTGGPGGSRPTEFKAGSDDEGTRLWTFTREKK